MSRRPVARADAAARLPAAPRLRPAAVRARRSAHPRRRARDRRGLRRADRALPRARPPRDRALGVRHRAGVRRRCTSIACCARRGCWRCATSSAPRRSTPGASEAFAVADHQVAHVYVRDPARIAEVRGAAASGARRRAGARPTRTARRSASITSARASWSRSPRRDRWFTYYYWLDDARAPDFARTVDIHRKPGYDPVELFLDPALALPKLKVAATLAKKALGFRYLMDVIPLDASLVRGLARPDHRSLDDGPVLISSETRRRAERRAGSTAVRDADPRASCSTQVPGTTRWSASVSTKPVGRDQPPAAARAARGNHDRVDEADAGQQPAAPDGPCPDVFATTVRAMM